MTEALPTEALPRVKRAFEAIVDQVEQSILSGALAPGDRLPGERELVAQFQVSRSSVREAMRVLQSGGFIASRPGDPRGSIILEPTSAPLSKVMTRLASASSTSLADLLVYRMTLESAATSLAASRRTDNDLRQLEQAIERMRGCQGDEDFSRADLDFHDVIAGTSGNAMIQVSAEAVRDSIKALIEHSIASSTADDALMQRTLVHHTDVLAAIRAQDAHRAEYLARSSLFEYYGELLEGADRDALAALASFGAPDAPGVRDVR